MLKFFKHLGLILPQIQNSLCPAFIFACAFLGYFLYGEISPFAKNNLHILFWTTNFLCLAILIYFNRQRPVFFLLTTIIAYIIINNLKQKYSLDYLSTNGYINLCFFVPINLILFYFLPERYLFRTNNAYWLIFIFLEIALGEYLNNTEIFLSLNSSADSINLNSLSVLLFSIFIICAFSRCCRSGYIDDTALFFSGLNIFAGFYYSANSTALCIFFAASSITALIGTIRNINFLIRYDQLTGLSNRRTYIKDSTKFPLKYSLAIICLDNYKHLYSVLGKIRTQKLLKMLVLRLTELEPDNPIYRYTSDEFIIIFKNDNLKQSFEKLDNIRREIASSEFMFSHRRKGIKITISGCVSEKKRSDADSLAVLKRTQDKLQKTYQFTQNLISKV